MYQGFQFFESAKADCRCRHILDRMDNVILEIKFPNEGDVRSRKIVTRSRARATGKYPSWKMGRMVQWESVNELNAYRLLDANAAAIAYHEQPLTIHFVLNGEAHKHYPDTMVQWGNSRELWEIKPSSEAIRPEYVERTRFLEAALPQLGFAYRMVLAEDLKKEPRLSNVLTVLKFGRAPISSLAREQFRQAILAAGGSISWGHIVNGQLGAHGRNIASRLILEGVLAINLEVQLTADSVLTWGSPAVLEKGKN